MTRDLRQLAESLGIESSYTDWQGGVHETSDSTRRALVEALGFSADEERVAGEAPGDVATSSPGCFGIDEALGGDRVFGLHVNLPALRGRHGWGVGGFGELHRLLKVAASWGADFIATSPMHALAPEAEPASPYSPLSRRYRHAFALDPEAVPEFAACEEALTLLAAPRFVTERAALVESASLHPARTAALKLPVLEALHRDFRARHEGRASERAREYESFVQTQGEALQGFATFMVLREAGLAGGIGLPLPGSSEIERFRDENEQRIAFHCFLQFEVERQAGELARAARAAGLRVGIVSDLALGSVRDGAETWASPERFALSVSLGAPPDALGPEGQDWDLPPWSPFRLETEDFAAWRELLRANFSGAGAGALRIDHVLGLVRQFLIPVGRPASEGAYLRQPSAGLFRVLAEESRRAGALVVGEDLGTLPAELPALLEQFGVLSTRVLRFERAPDGSFLSSESWPRRALALAGTHDLPPLAGWQAGSDLTLRALLAGADDDELERQVMARRQDVEMLLAQLRAEDLLQAGEVDAAEFTLAAHRFLLRTPSALVALQLEDLLGETEAFNVPGVPLERHASWSRPLPAFVEDLSGDPRVAARLPTPAERER